MSILGGALCGEEATALQILLVLCAMAFDLRVDRLPPYREEPLYHRQRSRNSESERDLRIRRAHIVNQ